MSEVRIEDIDTLTIIEWMKEYEDDKPIKEALFKEYLRRRGINK